MPNFCFFIGTAAETVSPAIQHFPLNWILSEIENAWSFFIEYSTKPLLVLLVLLLTAYKVGYGSRSFRRSTKKKKLTETDRDGQRLEGCSLRYTRLFFSVSSLIVINDDCDCDFLLLRCLTVFPDCHCHDGENVSCRPNTERNDLGTESRRSPTEGDCGEGWVQFEDGAEDGGKV